VEVPGAGVVPTAGFAALVFGYLGAGKLDEFLPDENGIFLIAFRRAMIPAAQSGRLPKTNSTRWRFTQARCSNGRPRNESTKSRSTDPRKT